jgi:predicted nucleic acid-binding Zn ribbon protein
MKEAVHIGSVISRLMKTYRRDSDSELAGIWDMWNGLVGEAISANARPAAFKGKLLLVNVTSSAWLHQFHFLKEDMIRKINEAYGKQMVDDIKFKIGPV